MSKDASKSRLHSMQEQLADADTVTFLNSLPSSELAIPLPPAAIETQAALAAPLDLHDYSLEQRLGVGGQGEVFLAQQRSLGRRVALKLLKPAFSGDVEAEQRFLREARTLAQTSHPQIVTIHGIGRSPGGQLFLVMEYIEGPDLARCILQQSFEMRTAVEIVARIAQAVEHAHSRGVIHRDLKPSNVLWHEVRGPVVTDFGLAKDLRSEHPLTVTEQMIGTPTYMAPEQAHRRFGDISTRTDVYGLAATLYALLTGQPPIPRGPLAEVLQQLTVDDPVADPRHWRPEIPQPLADLCRKGLAKFPEHRHASPLELANDLNRWLSEDGTRSVDVPPTVWNLTEPTAAAQIAPKKPTDRGTVSQPLPAAAPFDPDQALLHMWDQLDPELQDAFSLAYNKKRRTGSNRISTRDLFEAMARLGTGPLRDVFQELPAGALPEPIDASIPVDHSVLQEQPLLSDCVRESLTEFHKLDDKLQKLSPVDLFVDVAKHGHGASVVRLREHGVDPEAMERIVKQLGLRIVRRESRRL